MLNATQSLRMIRIEKNQLEFHLTAILAAMAMMRITDGKRLMGQVCHSSRYFLYEEK